MCACTLSTVGRGLDSSIFFDCNKIPETGFCTKKKCLEAESPRLGVPVCSSSGKGLMMGVIPVSAIATGVAHGVTESQGCTGGRLTSLVHLIVVVSQGFCM